MIAIVGSILLLLLSLPIKAALPKVILLLGAQLLLLAPFLLKRSATAVGAFVFMSVVFFGLRPLYLTIENDYELLLGLFRANVNEVQIGDAMWWATLALLFFVIGGFWGQDWGSRKAESRGPRPHDNIPPLLSLGFGNLLLCYQLGSVLLMVVMGGAIQYGTSFGAYLYDFPVLLQGGQLFAVLVLSERFQRSRGKIVAGSFILSLTLFLGFTLLLRSTTLFRGQWITGLMVLGLAFGMRWRNRFPLAYVALPILLMLPLFRVLGQLRFTATSEIKTELTEVPKDEGVLTGYWDFLDSKGDINIFDTFVAAVQSEPEFHPYLLSWLYVPVHFVPRALWAGKPERGVTQDLSFANGAPYSPGIAGFFWLDGGFLWMLFSMLLLGWVVGAVETSVVTHLNGYLRLCFYAAMVVNALFLTRFFLWQWFYQTLYFMVPCYLFHRASRRYQVGPATGPMPPNGPRRARPVAHGRQGPQPRLIPR